MEDMTRAIARKAPATIVDTRPRQTLTAPYHARADLIRAVRRGAQRGEIIPQHAHPVWSPERGLWVFEVRRIKPEPPAWRRPVAIGAGVVAAAGGLLWLVWWTLTSLSPLALAILCVAAVATLARVTRAGRAPSIQVTQVSNITIRRR
jgi:hypothetical protein